MFIFPYLWFFKLFFNFILEYSWLTPGGGHGSPFQYSCLENPYGQKRQVGYSPWGHKGSEKTKRLSTVRHVADWHCCDRFRGQKGTQPCITRIHSPSYSLPIQAATKQWAEFPVLYRRPLLVIHFKYGSVYMPISYIYIVLYKSEF